MSELGMTKLNRKSAEDLIYASYMKASACQTYKDKDCNKRHPEITRDWIGDICKTYPFCSREHVVLVTGSKGKGSVATMAALIMSASKRVGVMTSPHLIDFCERFRLNDVMISDEDFVATMEALMPRIADLEEGLPEDFAISPMGIQTALALTYFGKNETDVAILECGKGARYDDVNNVPHDFAIINGIFLEHTRELGETLEEIAEDKACVICPGMKAAFSMEQEEEVLAVLEARAKECQVPFYYYGRDFCADNICFTTGGMCFDVVIAGRRYEGLQVPLLGSHQARNCALAMALAERFLGEDTLLDSLALVKEYLLGMNWPGRMELLWSEPFVMLDACINAANVDPVIEVVKALGIGDFTAIVGIPEDKDYLGVITKLKGVTSKLILTKSQNPYYHFSKEQVNRVRELGVDAQWAESIVEAVQLAKSYGKPIVILGTTSLVGECEKWKRDSSSI